jgi:periplasmic divalent cation tolerance protein
VGGAAYCQVEVTASSVEEAERLGRLAVEGRLAACAQVSGPISSTYWWEGRVTSTTEWVCTLKTSSLRITRLTSVLREAHSYEVPQIVVTSLSGGDEEYLGWIGAETGTVGEHPAGDDPVF